jgi:hypothetical protein
MPEYEAHIIEKITSHEADPAELPDSIVSELPHFDLPEIIKPSKVAAILKAMLESTSGDKFNFGNCYTIPISTGQSISSFVGDRLRGLGIGYHDFLFYLRDRGWLNE